MQDYPIIDLFIVGAQKAFTTSLKNYLGEHPSVITHPQQEMAFFVDDKEYTLGYKRALTHYFKNITTNTSKRLVAKSALLYLSDTALERLYKHNPDCKIVLNLRNPVDRAYSAYLLERNYAQLDFSFNEIKKIASQADDAYWPYSLFINSGNYAKYLKNIYKYFPKNQVKIILYEEMIEDPLKVCRDLFTWMNIENSFTPQMVIHNATTKHGSKKYGRFIKRMLRHDSIIRKPIQLFIPSYYHHKIGNTLKKINKTSTKYPAMDADTRKFLLDYFKNANKDLEELIGKNVSELWNK